MRLCNDVLHKSQPIWGLEVACILPGAGDIKLKFDVTLDGAVHASGNNHDDEEEDRVPPAPILEEVGQTVDIPGGG